MYLCLVSVYDEISMGISLVNVIIEALWVVLHTVADTPTAAPD